MTHEDFKAINADFVDLTIRRWELLIEHHIALRHGMAPSEEEGDAPNPTEQLRTALAEVDGQLTGLRQQVDAAGRTFPMDQLVGFHHLDLVEASVLQLAMMPQLDLSFRHRIARFNNNILYDFVDVDLALTLLFGSRRQRLEARAYFAADARLFVNKLLTFATPKDAKGSGLLGQELAPPERLSDFVLCRRTLDTALRGYAELEHPTATLDEVALPADEMREIVGLVRYFADIHGEGQRQGVAGPFPVGGPGLTVALTGPPGTGKSMLVRAIAHALSRPLIQVACSRLAGVNERFAGICADLFNEARVQGAVLVFDRCETLFNKGNAKLPTLLGQLERFGGLTMLTTSHRDDMDSGVERFVGWAMDLGMPEIDERLRIWKTHLTGRVPLADDVDLDDMATRYEITGSQIRNACAVAETRTLAAPERTEMRHSDLKAAAQAQLRANMEDYSIKSKIKLRLVDLILPDKEMALVQEVLEACKNRVYVMSKWGFGRRLVTGRGICVLFKGEPGTGKTLCAEILAAELGMQLYQISIPKIVSKYIGETEKNLSKIFSSARANHSMLLFDEADSLFTKRVNVENSIDRFSNMETNQLLQEIERFEGITILTTNLDKNIDDAFARRIQFKIDFPYPDAEHRSLIWRTMFPKECPIDGEIDFDELGENFELAGGNIKNAVIRAAYRAAASSGAISYGDVEFAAEQECKNAGKLFRTGKKYDDF